MLSNFIELQVIKCISTNRHGITLISMQNITGKYRAGNKVYIFLIPFLSKMEVPIKQATRFWLLALIQKVWKPLPDWETEMNIAISLKMLYIRGQDERSRSLSIPTARQTTRGVCFPFILGSISVTSFCLVGVCLSIFNCWVGEEPTSVVFPLVVPAREKAVRFLADASGLNLLLQCDEAEN